MKKTLNTVLVLLIVIAISFINTPASVLADMTDAEYCQEFGERCPLRSPLVGDWQGSEEFKIGSNESLPPPPQDYEKVTFTIEVSTPGAYWCETRGAAYGWEYIAAQLNVEPGTVGEVGWNGGMWGRVTLTTERFPDEEGAYRTSFYAQTPGIYTIFRMYTGE